MERTQTIFTENQPLSAHGLACRRGGRAVFEGLAFRAEPGALLFLRGRNGCGKSTLLRMIAGFVPATAGHIQYGDDRWAIGAAAASEALVYVGHDHGLKPALTLAENARNYALLMTGQAVATDRLIGAADQFGLLPLLHQPVRFFSSGQRHRASLMRFLLADRPIWLMDEPTVGLDAENRLVLAALMRAHLARRGTIFAATHDPIDVPGAVLDVAAFQPERQSLEHFL